MTEQPPPIADWHYTLGGQQKGPVPEGTIKAMLETAELGEDTQVWRTGMKGWLPLRESDLSHLLQSTPPPVSSTLVSNALVWIVAILPIVVGVIDASLAAQPGVAFGRALGTHGGLPFREPEIPWFIPSIISAAFCLWDERRLKKAGYSNKWMVGFALILTPVYLFVRAKRLKQWPTYTICWIVLTLVAVFLVAAVRSA